MNKLNSANKHIVFSYINTGIGIITSIVFLQYSSTSFYGKYGILKNILGLLDYSHFGTRYGLDFENGKQTLLKISNFLSLLISSILIICFSFLGKLNLLEIIFLISSISLILFQNYRISKRVINLSEFIRITFLLNFVLSALPILIIFFSDELVLIPMIIFNLLLLVILIKINSIGISFDRLLVYKMITKYNSLMFIHAFTVLIILSDRFLINMFLDSKLAHYALSSFISTLALVLPGSLWETKLKEIVNKSINQIKKVLNAFFLLNGVFLIIACIIIFLGLDFGISFINTEYIGISNEVIIVFISNSFLFFYYVLCYCEYSMKLFKIQEILLLFAIYVMITWIAFPYIHYLYFLILRLLLIFVFFVTKFFKIVLFPYERHK